jgi:hypothetical protein
MMTLAEFCFIIDKRKPARMNNLTLKEIYNVEYATEFQQKDPKLDKDLYNQLQFYKKEPAYFRDVIHKNLIYRDPEFINISALCMNAIATSSENFVMPLFLQSGKFSYVIEYNSKFYFHKAVIHVREETIPFSAPDSISLFKKNDSVFSGWKEDINPIIQGCFEHDLRHLVLE